MLTSCVQMPTWSVGWLALHVQLRTLCVTSRTLCAQWRTFGVQLHTLGGGLRTRRVLLQTLVRSVAKLRIECSTRCVQLRILRERLATHVSSETEKPFSTKTCPRVWGCSCSVRKCPRTCAPPCVRVICDVVSKCIGARVPSNVRMMAQECPQT